MVGKGGLSVDDKFYSNKFYSNKLSDVEYKLWFMFMAVLEIWFYDKTQLLFHTLNSS